MIIHYSNKYHPTINEIVPKLKENNLYLYLDYLFYGPISEETDTWVQTNDNGELLNIVLKYRNSIQLMNVRSLFDAEELSSFLDSLSPVMISGSRELIETITLPRYASTNGYLMRLTDSKAKNKETIFLSVNNFNTLRKAAAFVCSDQEIGGAHYTIDDLTDQFIKRQKNWGCRNIVGMNGDEIICHLATYAESKDCAILGGLLVNKKYRNKGYGGMILDYVSSTLINECKNPYLYCYKESLRDYYKKRGWSVVLEVSKLEREA